jgi:hypothetical protein
LEHVTLCLILFGSYISDGARLLLGRFTLLRRRVPGICLITRDIDKLYVYLS